LNCDGKVLGGTQQTLPESEMLAMKAAMAKFLVSVVVLAVEASHHPAMVFAS
jgi:hypothetical protein